MEQQDILSDRETGRGRITTEQVIEGLRKPPANGRRRSNDDARQKKPEDLDSEGNPWWSGVGELRPAAVLVPLVDRESHLTVVLTKRTDHLKRHAGQISFPGGRFDEGDESPLHTALRETEEEIGLHRRHIEHIGELDEYIVGTGYLVNPMVGLIRPPFDMTPEPGEVAEIFEAPLDFLMDTSNYERRHRDSNGVRRYFYAINYQGYDIWGATAGMLRNLSERLETL